MDALEEDNGAAGGGNMKTGTFERHLRKISPSFPKSSSNPGTFYAQGLNFRRVIRFADATELEYGYSDRVHFCRQSGEGLAAMFVAAVAHQDATSGPCGPEEPNLLSPGSTASHGGAHAL